MPHRISVLIFPDFQLLDAAGPIAAFEIAGAFQAKSYRIDVRAATAGPVRSSSGVTWQARPLGRASSIGTLIVAGGNGTRAAAACPVTRNFLLRCCAAGVRVSSVCSGSYLLAAAGILDGLAATTHWSRAEDFRQRFSRVRLEPDRIFIKSGKIWTSAGISAGIDLALALIEEDLGDKLARRTAQQLVVYHRRPGGQSQFSAMLELTRAEGRFAELLEFVRSHLREPLSVPQLAQRAGMSGRNFSRAFRTETGLTPARAVEKLRAEAARAALQSGADSVAEVAQASGFNDPERMRRAFLRLYGVSPASVKRQTRLQRARRAT